MSVIRVQYGWRRFVVGRDGRKITAGLLEPWKSISEGYGGRFVRIPEERLIVDGFGNERYVTLKISHIEFPDEESLVLFKLSCP